MTDPTLATIRCPECNVEYSEGGVCPIDGSTLVAKGAEDPLIGQVLKGTFKICAKLGEGGMAQVYRAVQLPINRTVAVKVVFTHTPSAAADLGQRFLREGRLLSQISHPNVVRLIDFGNTPAGMFYMVMEHLSGKTLESIVPASQGLPVMAIREIMQQICDGVEAAHSHQMVHRDLKPANIFLHTVGPQAFVVKVLDFGIARPLDDVLSPLTQTGVMLGSCGYMAPEQITGTSDVDARADVYALGGLLYFLLTGQQAYRGRTTRLVLAKQMSQIPEPIDFQALGKPEAAPLMSVILKAMSHDPASRHQTAGELLKAIEGALPEEGTLGVRRPTRIILPSPSATGTTVVRDKTAVNRKLLPSLPADATARPRTKQVPRATKNRAEGPRPRPAKPKKGRKRIPLSIGVLVGVVLLALEGAGGYFLLANKHVPPTTLETGKNPNRARGVSDTEIKWGMSAPFNGPAQALGTELKTGVETYFRSRNDQGGIHGRKLTLIPLDDGYTPDRAVANMDELNSQYQVFGYIGNVGTPTALKTLPYAIEHKMLFFTPFTGADKQLREVPPARFVFHYRASYAEETAWMVEYLIKVKNIKPEQIAVFAQKDGYGDAGFSGVAKALRKKYSRDGDQILRVGYERNTEEVDAAVAEILGHKELKAVIMVPTYKAAANFIHKLRDAGAPLIFGSVSFVGSDALADELKLLGRKYAEGVIVTQVVPHPESSATAVLQYRELLKKYSPEKRPTFVSLEGFIDAMLLARALDRAGPDLTTDKLIDSLESIQDLDLGLGPALGYRPSDHQASHKVWGTVLDGSFRYQPIDDFD